MSTWSEERMISLVETNTSTEKSSVASGSQSWARRESGNHQITRPARITPTDWSPSVKAWM